MPKLWSKTIETHRSEVRDAILDATGAIALRRGLGAVTMSDVAEQAGVGRSTLYKYFTSVEAILVAWHERHVDAHLRRVEDAVSGPGDPLEKLTHVLEVYAMSARRKHEGELAAKLHAGAHATAAHGRLLNALRELLAAGVKAGSVRDDSSPAELAAFCLHATGAAADLSAPASIQRLVAITVDGVRARPRRR